MTPSTPRYPKNTFDNWNDVVTMKNADDDVSDVLAYLNETLTGNGGCWVAVSQHEAHWYPDPVSVNDRSTMEWIAQHAD